MQLVLRALPIVTLCAFPALSALPAVSGEAVVGHRERLGGASELGSFPAGCANTIEDDANPGTCLQASTTPTLGRLYPITSNLFVDPGGNIGINTTSPTARLEVAGTARITDTLTLAPGTDQAMDLSTGSIYRAGVLFLHGNGGNTGVGNNALATAGGTFNAAVGESALQSNISGTKNAAFGAGALAFNLFGIENAACGMESLHSNVSGSFNAASGAFALRQNTSGSMNTAAGHGALGFNNGDSNAALGRGALGSNTTGSNNIAVGAFAGVNLTTGDDNIAIGNAGIVGEAATIRIGSGSHTRAFMAGIHGTTTDVADAIPVLVDSSGQLGTISSSRRFKEDIRDMGDATSRLLELRPVTFRYQQEQTSPDGQKAQLEYGLIAEEVAEVFPDLVVYDREGQPFTVKYHLLSSMLLNELKKQEIELTALRSEIDEQGRRLAALEAPAYRSASMRADVGSGQF